MGANPSHDMAAPVIVASQAKHTASLIFLHGLGDTGAEWVSTFRKERVNYLKKCLVILIWDKFMGGYMVECSIFIGNKSYIIPHCSVTFDWIVPVLSSQEWAKRSFLATVFIEHISEESDFSVTCKEFWGNDGHGWASMFRDFGLKNVRCVCPTAPIQPVSLNGRMKMPSWFDITGLSADSPEDEEGILSASESLKKLIEEEEKLGIPSSRIMIGGFSQGGSVALYTAFTMKKPLAGILALSTWMPLNKKFPAVVQGNTDIPVLQCHGTDDPLVSIRWGQLTGTLISTFNKHHQLKIYSGMVHSSCDQELKDVKVFLEANLKD